MIAKVAQPQKPKHQQVYDQLVEALTSKQFKIGNRLPSERDFANDLNVNVLTVRRAFRELIAGGIVEKRVGSGTYLVRPLTDNWNEHDVNIVIDTNSTSAIQRNFEKLGPVVAERHGRNCRLLYSDKNNIREIIRSSQIYRQPTILCGVTELDAREFYKEIHKSPELFVVFSSMLHEEGIPNIMGDDTTGINMLMEHLQGLGHRKIAFLTSNSTGIGKIQAAVWSAGLGSDYHPSLKIELDKDSTEDQIHGAHNMVAQVLKTVDFSALICVTDELMFGAAAALRESGRSIPDDVSIVSIGNTSLSYYHNPPVSCIDPNLEAHLEEAFKMLFYNLNHPTQVEKLRLIKPILIIRESTTKNKTRRSAS